MPCLLWGELASHEGPSRRLAFTGASTFLGPSSGQTHALPYLGRACLTSLLERSSYKESGCLQVLLQVLWLELKVCLS